MQTYTPIQSLTFSCTGCPPFDLIPYPIDRAGLDIVTTTPAGLVKTTIIRLMLPLLLIAFIAHLPFASCHIAFWHPSMWGFNVTFTTFSYDNRPVSPLMNYTFDQWWFHGHLDYPPNPGDIFDLPAGRNATAQLACNKGATDFFASSDGGDIRDPSDEQNPCPGSPISEFHTMGEDDLKGCALAIAYKDNVTAIQPQDFTVFSVNQTCVWYRNTTFQVPERMPPCPAGGCTCAWFWIHSPDSGSEQNYMNGFKCNVSNPTSSVPLAAPQVPRRCGVDPEQGKAEAVPGNCTYGAKQPLYWFQAEDNTLFEDPFHPPFYLDLYNFADGAQNDIFADSYVGGALGMPVPGPNQTAVPQLAQVGGSSSSTQAASSSATSSITSTGTSGSVPVETNSAPSPASPNLYSQCRLITSSLSKRGFDPGSDSAAARVLRLLGVARHSRILMYTGRDTRSVWNPLPFSLPF